MKYGDCVARISALGFLSPRTFLVSPVITVYPIEAFRGIHGLSVAAFARYRRVLSPSIPTFALGEECRPVTTGNKSISRLSTSLFRESQERKSASRSLDFSRLFPTLSSTLRRGRQAFMRIRKLNDTMRIRLALRSYPRAGLSLSGLMTLRYSNRDRSLETRVAHSNSVRDESTISQDRGNSRARNLGARDNGKLITPAIYHKLELARSPWPTFIRVGQRFEVARRKLMEIDVGARCYDDDIDSHRTPTRPTEPSIARHWGEGEKTRANMLIESNIRGNFRDVAITRHAGITGGYYASITTLRPRKLPGLRWNLLVFMSLGKYMEQPSGGSATLPPLPVRLYWGGAFIDRNPRVRPTASTLALRRAATTGTPTT
ncbi:hypothetical protein DBV15_08327 [Temnothorax longispinosus]|uniref:Uncharacterized protein n=1 Tax=Temnothorax longispinosus TaxID=300112 RepID=A0A4V3SCQ7_9HYME|nr:hypothetical protein DBV15_08327 [Temnothorax longispinosus]